LIRHHPEARPVESTTVGYRCPVAYDYSSFVSLHACARVDAVTRFVEW